MLTINLSKKYARMAKLGKLTEVTHKKVFEVGDVIGVREPLYATSQSDYVYACESECPAGYKHWPSFMMPNSAIRTYLRVTWAAGEEYGLETCEAPLEGPKSKPRRTRRNMVDDRIKKMQETIEALEKRVRELEK